MDTARPGGLDALVARVRSAPASETVLFVHGFDDTCTEGLHRRALIIHGDELEDAQADVS